MTRNRCATRERERERERRGSSTASSSPLWTPLEPGQGGTQEGWSTGGQRGQEIRERENRVRDVREAKEARRDEDGGEGETSGRLAVIRRGGREGGREQATRAKEQRLVLPVLREETGEASEGRGLRIQSRSYIRL